MWYVKLLLPAQLNLAHAVLLQNISRRSLCAIEIVAIRQVAVRVCHMHHTASSLATPLQIVRCIYVIHCLHCWLTCMLCASRHADACCDIC